MKVKICEVVAQSSESPDGPAVNVLNDSKNKVWLANADETAILLIQLEKAVRFDSITIGNNGGHLVEVFAGSSLAMGKDFTRIVPSTELMNQDLKQLHGVKMLRKEHFIGDAVKLSYDRLRFEVTCPPWAKSDRFGLTFVEVHSVEPTVPSQIGLFKKRSVDPTSTASNVFRAVGLVKRVSEEVSSRPAAAAAALEATLVHPDSAAAGKPLTPGAALSQQIKQKRPLPTYLNSRPPIAHSSADAAKLKAKLAMKTSQHRDSKSSGGPTAAASASPGVAASNVDDDDDDDLSAYEKMRQKNIRENAAKFAQLGLAKPAVDPPQRPKKTQSRTTQPERRQSKRPSASAASASGHKAKKRRSQRAPAPVGVDMPMKQIMRGCTFVLSGFQNPLRAEIRKKAIELGGWYQPDWSPRSTHLICAFVGTPKYTEVKQKGGKITTKEWVLDQHRQQKQFPASGRYLLDVATAEAVMDAEDSEDEDDGDDDLAGFIVDDDDDDDLDEFAGPPPGLDDESDDEYSPPKNSSPSASSPNVFDADTEDEEEDSLH